MDDYLAMDEADLTREDLERRGGKKKRIGLILILLGLICGLAAAAWTFYNYREDMAAGEQAMADLQKMEEMLGTDADGDGLIGTVPAEEYRKAHNMNPLSEDEAAETGNGQALGAAKDGAAIYELHPEMSMPTVEVDGHMYVGFLDIPAIERTLPVMDTWSYPNLKIAPNRFVGTPYAHDMIICAHNYDRHFGRIKNLREGDEVTFTDVYGDRFFYKVSEVIILQPTDVEEMKDPDDWDLTLFTCTIGGATRVTVRCVMTGSEAGSWTTASKADLSEKIEELQNQSETKAS